MRWLFVSIFIIYAFGTSGEYVQYFSGNYAPTYEGCVLGMLQIAKLVIALASLTILFASSSTEELMIGLYMMLSPLKLLGFEIERFTARLLLTLDCVEELAVKEKYTFSFHDFDKLHSATENLQEKKLIVLQSPPFTQIDKLLMIIIITSLLVLAINKVVA
jgi:energy-coupling factor transport system permease protein